MRYFLTKWKKRGARLAAMVLVFGFTALVVAYILGFFEVSFLDRESLFGTDPPAAETNPGDNLPATDTLPPQTDSDIPDSPETNDSQTGDTPGPDGQTDVLRQESRSVKNIIQSDLLSDKTRSFSTADFLSRQGYTLHEATDWNSSMRLGKMQFSYKLPEKYSVNTRTAEEIRYVYPADNSEVSVEYVKVTEDRPAIELYMGYILYDRGDQLILIDNDGTVLFAFDDTYTIPAYVRDKNGLPLFYRWSWTEEGQEKTWFRLADDKKSFVPSDYDELLDDRGLCFDYPAYYGLPSDNLYRVAEAEDAMTMRLQEEADRVAALTPEEAAAEEEERLLQKTVVAAAYPKQRLGFTRWGTDLTGLVFRNAYNFSGGMAAVTADADRQALYFINTYGTKVLHGNRTYLRTEYERYVMESWRLPVSWGIESIGSLYFDHDLVRVRKQTIDYYAYMTYDNVRVISDEEILVDRKGNEFPTPAGYVLKGYSNGMLLLEKNGRYGFMDYTGNWIAEPIYAGATPFISGLATLTTSDNRTGMIDTQGNIVLPFAYDAISQASSGLIAAYRENEGWQIFGMMGR